MARAPKKQPFDKGDWVWIQARVTRTQASEAGELEHLTVVLSNGHLETLRYNPDSVKAGAVVHTW